MEAAGGQAAEPLNWVKSWEWVGTTQNTIFFPATLTGGSWICPGVNNYGPYTANNQASAAQAVIDAANCRAGNGSGTLILYPAGSLFSGAAGIVLTQVLNDNSTNFIVLDSTTPTPWGLTVCGGVNNVRNPGCTNDLAKLWTVEATAGNPAISTGPPDGNNIGPHHYAIVNAELRPSAANTTRLAIAATGTHSETLTSQFPAHIHWLADYFHADAPADWTSGNITVNNNIANALNFAACTSCSWMFSYFDRIIPVASQGESHGVQYGYVQTMKNAHNYVEGASIGLLTGGYGGTLAIAGPWPVDVEDRSSAYWYPDSYIAAAVAGVTVNGGNFYQKNRHELKVGKRYLMNGLIFHGSDNTGGQSGIILSIKTDSSSAGIGENYTNATQDITLTNFRADAFCRGISAGFPSVNQSGNGGGVTSGVSNIKIASGLLYNGGDAYGGLCTGASPTNPYLLKFTSADVTWPCSATSNGSSNETLTCTGSAGQNQLNFTTGKNVYVTGCSDATFNTTNSGLGPAAQATTPSSLSVTFANPGVTISSSATSCVLHNIQGTPKNVSITHVTAVGSGGSGGTMDVYDDLAQTTGQFAIGSTIQNNLLLGQWPNTTQGGGFNSQTEGTRMMATTFDLASLQFNNNVVSQRALNGVLSCNGANPDVCLYVSGDNCGANPFYTRIAASGNIQLNGTIYPVASSSAVSTCKITLTGTGPSGGAITYYWADYTEYGGTNNGLQPAPTAYMPLAANCITNDATTENCAGLFGAMSIGAYPQNLADYHGYRLCKATDAACNNHASPFAAGQANQATDATDMGANIAAIDAAFSSLKYICTGSCGTGPYSDIPPTTVSGGRLLIR